MGAFLSWFGDSQALDRIIKLERLGVSDEKIIMELTYMVKKVYLTMNISKGCYNCLGVRETESKSSKTWPRLYI